MLQMHPSAVLATNEEEGDSSSVVVVTFGLTDMDRSALLRRLEAEEDSSFKGCSFLCYWCYMVLSYRISY